MEFIHTLFCCWFTLWSMAERTCRFSASLYCLQVLLLLTISSTTSKSRNYVPSLQSSHDGDSFLRLFFAQGLTYWVSYEWKLFSGFVTKTWCCLCNKNNWHKQRSCRSFIDMWNGWLALVWLMMVWNSWLLFSHEVSRVCVQFWAKTWWVIRIICNRDKSSFQTVLASLCKFSEMRNTPSCSHEVLDVGIAKSQMEMSTCLKDPFVNFFSYWD